MSLVNFLRFVVREEFVYVWRCRWLLGQLRLPGPRDQNGIRNWNVKWSVISCQGGVWGPDAIVMRVMGYHILGAQIIDLLSSFSYYWSFYYLVRTLSPQWLSPVFSARHASPQKLLSFSSLHSTSHTNHHRSISPSTYPWIPELTSRLLTFTF